MGRSRARLRVGLGAMLVAGLALLLSGCAGNGEGNMPNDPGPVGGVELDLEAQIDKAKQDISEE